jgi:hypothetical protein
LDEARFVELRSELGILDPKNLDWIYLLTIFHLSCYLA